MAEGHSKDLLTRPQADRDEGNAGKPTDGSTSTAHAPEHPCDQGIRSDHVGTDELPSTSSQACSAVPEGTGMIHRRY